MRGNRRGGALVALGLMVLVVSFTVGVFANATGQSPERSTIRLNAKLGSYHKVDVSPKKDSAGDIFQFTDKLSGDLAGRDGANCVHTNKKYFECTWTVVLPDGTFQAEGLAFDTDAGYTLAVVGGTGAYFGARGEMRVTDATKAVAHYEISYLLP